MGADDGITHWEGPPLEAWAAWTPHEAAAVLRDVDVPWCVVGGWSIDLHLGRETRPHDDLEIAIARPDLPVVRAALAAYDLFVVGDGEVRSLPPGAVPPPHRHQTWVLDPAARAWRMDVMLEPGDHDTWVFRRDETIRAPRSTMVGRTDDGIPYLLPHGALLYKAKPEPRPKDEADFEVCAPHLSDGARAWLQNAIRRTTPDHPWLGRLR